MRPAAPNPEEWADGFLLLANRPILDFLNTRPILVPADGPIELLSDTHALERWLIASGLITSSKTKALLRSWRNTPALATLLKDLIAYRERLRESVLRIENGGSATDEFLREVNVRLAEYPLPTTLRKQDGVLVRETLIAPEKPADLWALIADATADLLADSNLSRMHKCESCVMHFYDTSKKGSRRWCSMNLCGNKLKVAAYQKRKREEEAAK